MSKLIEKNITKDSIDCITAELQLLLNRHTANLHFNINDVNYKYIDRLIRNLIPDNFTWLTELKYEVHISYNNCVTNGATITIFVVDENKQVKEFHIRLVAKINKFPNRSFRRCETVVLVEDAKCIRIKCGDYRLRLNVIECLMQEVKVYAQTRIRF